MWGSSSSEVASHFQQNFQSISTFSPTSHLTPDCPTMANEVPVCMRVLLWYVANNGTTFHHTDSVSVVTIAILSLKSKLFT